MKAILCSISRNLAAAHFLCGDFSFLSNSASWFSMREAVIHLVLFVCLFTGRTAASDVLRLRRPEETSSSKVEIDRKSMTSSAFRLTNGTELQISPFVHHGQPLLKHHHNNTRRKLGDFRECSPCTCCDSTRQWCLPTMCCYDINCGLQGLPFGLCSFTPISCTCLGCRD